MQAREFDIDVGKSRHRQRVDEASPVTRKPLVFLDTQTCAGLPQSVIKTGPSFATFFARVISAGQRRDGHGSPLNLNIIYVTTFSRHLPILKPSTPPPPPASTPRSHRARPSHHRVLRQPLFLVRLRHERKHRHWLAFSSTATKTIKQSVVICNSPTFGSPACTEMSMCMARAPRRHYARAV